MEGTHVEIGWKFLRNIKENPNVINAVEAHHGDVEPQTIEAVLVLSSMMQYLHQDPGAGRETLRNIH